MENDKQYTGRLLMVYLLNEIRYMLHNKKICISFIILFFLNIVLVISYIDVDSLDASVYRALRDKVVQEKVSVMELFFNDSESPEIKSIYEEYTRISDYASYLNKIQTETEESKGISIFQTEF